jgi:general secretion pathway protein E
VGYNDVLRCERAANAADFARSLIAAGKVSESAVDRARRVSAESGEHLELVLPRLGLISERELSEAFAGFLKMPLVSAKDFPVEPVLEDRLNVEFLRERHLIPLADRGDGILIAMANPLDTYAADAVRFATNRPVHPCVAYPSDLDAAFQRLYDDSKSNIRRIVDLAAERRGHKSEEDIERLQDSSSEAPVIRLVNLLIVRAVEASASDIHVEPGQNELRIRFRIDGVLEEMESSPPQLAAAVLSRIKVMAKLNIAERRLPQDGRIATAVRGKDIDIRVATSPTIHGERATLRLLDRSQVKLDFDALGFDETVSLPLREILARPYGIVLVTGPTGSGKTTTLYAALSELNRTDTNVLTIEDPIEYQLAGVNQVQIKPQIGLSFAAALRSFLRQDPDIMMVGEIRDLETAQIAVQAALTGHLILSTVHTNDAASTVTRLLDMGVENYLITSTLNGVIAQRLVRTLCTTCREPHEALPALLERLEIPSSGKCMLFRPKGCTECNGTGYRGRSAIVEVLPITDAVRNAILRSADASQILNLAIESGMQTMRAHGLKKVLSGTTTVEEVLRVTKAAR